MIYLITNKINNKRYVGKTKTTLAKRWSSHCSEAKYGGQRYLCRAIRKYGEENFIIECIEECDNSQNNTRERFWIKELAPEYNMTEGGDGGWICDQTGKRWKVKDSSRMGKTWRKNPFNSKPYTSSGKNYQSTHYIITPWGEFETWRDALNKAKKLRSEGRYDTITDEATLKKYCKEDIILNKDGRRTFPEWRGKSTRSIGFNWIPKNYDKNNNK